MTGHYLSNNNETCYNTKTNNFSPTKQSGDCQCVIIIILNARMMGMGRLYWPALRISCWYEPMLKSTKCSGGR